jgi:hypothetical protein
MLGVLVLLAASGIQPATQAQFWEQARTCGVSLKYRVDHMYDAQLSADGRELTVRDNLSNGRRVKCMIDWATKHHLNVSIWQS